LRPTVTACPLAINFEHYGVMVMVSAAVWLIAPVPLVEAVTVTALATGWAPPLLLLLVLLLPQEAKPAANKRTVAML
jgi:hypothetical protein